jgi:hypothetical protein
MRYNMTLAIGLMRLRERTPRRSRLVDPTDGGDTRAGAWDDDRVSIDREGRVSISEWCSAFIDRIESDIAGRGAIAFRGISEARLALASARVLSLTLGELIAEAIERSLEGDRPPRMSVTLSEDDDNRIRILISDDEASTGIPLAASVLAASLGAYLRDIGKPGRSQRELAFLPPTP